MCGGNGIEDSNAVLAKAGVRILPGVMLLERCCTDRETGTPGWVM